MRAPHVTEIFDDLASAIQVPQRQYESAERSYNSVGRWLHRENSALRSADPQVYVQGSFRLGTAIRPLTNTDEYDLDLVCELSLSKNTHTQAEVKQLLGAEMNAYAQSQGMNEPVESRRCWTLDYSDEAQFHMDTLPAIPDPAGQRSMLKQHGHTSEWSGTAIAITDWNHPTYREYCNSWPHSNPKGYASWLWSRMATVFRAHREALALREQASIEDIPEYRVQTPLQKAVKILKRHRDIRFQDTPDDKPISIILTTLAGHAYREETTTADALFAIISEMEKYITYHDGHPWIGNPTDPRENFADRWRQHPERHRAFTEWLEIARADFAAAADTGSRRKAEATLKQRFGNGVIEEAAVLRRQARVGSQPSGLQRLLDRLNPAHRQTPPWRLDTQGQVDIVRALASGRGRSELEFTSNGPALPKHQSLRFEATTNIPSPFQVFWQVVNTGDEAAAVPGQLRGGFDEGTVTSGRLTKTESTLYAGTHSIECFIVKNGCLAARSGQFIVNIE